MLIRVTLTRDHEPYGDKRDVKPGILHELDEQASELPSLIIAPKALFAGQNCHSKLCLILSDTPRDISFNLFYYLLTLCV